MKLKAVTGPTPGIDMKRRAQLVAGDEPDHQIVQPAVLLPQRRARCQHRVHQLAGQRIAGDGIAHRLLEAAAAGALMRMPKVFSEWRTAFSISSTLRFRLRRCVSRSRIR